MQKRNYSEYKTRILAVERMLGEKPLTTTDIINKLDLEYNIKCDRKSIYSDINVLSMYMPNLYRLKPPKRGYVLVNDINKWQDQIDFNF